MSFRRWVAAGFGLGLIPRRLWGSDQGAGTFGAALMWVVSALLWHRPWWVHLLVFALAVAASVWAAAPFAADHADPGWVVIDEIAGTAVAVVGLHGGWPWLVAIAVARAADIWKVLPGVGAAERLPGGWGVTMDDVVAGCYGLAAGWLVVWLL